jgi:hypothetical protein
VEIMSGKGTVNKVFKNTSDGKRFVGKPRKA